MFDKIGFVIKFSFKLYIEAKNPKQKKKFKFDCFFHLYCVFGNIFKKYIIITILIIRNFHMQN